MTESPAPLSVERALVTILDAAEHHLAVTELPREEVGVEEAIGRVLAAPCSARWPLPGAPLSIMDGYAVRSRDLLEAREIHDAETLAVELRSESAAGHPSAVELEPGTCVRIATGAVIPAGADAVVPQEDTRRVVVAEREVGEGVLGERVLIELQRVALDQIEPGRYVRPIGSDVGDGELLIEAGVEIGGGEASLLAGTGNFTVAVYRRPRVAILSSGDELVPIGQVPRRGQIVSTNAMLLAAQIREAGGEPLDLGLVADTRADMRAAIERARDEADLLVATGGISVGDHDLVLPVLRELGFELGFRKLALRPGRPTTFGRLPRPHLPPGRSGTAAPLPVLALPGNPASTLVAFELVARPLVRALAGYARPRWLRPRRLVTLGGAAQGDRRRDHYLRASLDERGRAYPLAKQLSGALRSISCFDALVRVPAGQLEVPVGAQLEALIVRG